MWITLKLLPSSICMAENLERLETYISSLVKDLFAEKRQKGKISLVHDIDHVKAVADYGSTAAEFFASKHNLSPEERKRISKVAAVTGWCHDIVREATETSPHGSECKKYLERLYNIDHTIPFLVSEETWNIIGDVVGSHELGFDAITEKYENRPIPELCIAQGIVVGDKLVEASGPRVLERRSFLLRSHSKYFLSYLGILSNKS